MEWEIMIYIIELIQAIINSAGLVGGIFIISLIWFFISFFIFIFPYLEYVGDRRSFTVCDWILVCIVGGPAMCVAVLLVLLMGFLIAKIVIPSIDLFASIKMWSLFSPIGNSIRKFVKSFMRNTYGRLGNFIGKNCPFK
jgi:hypothetical protein